MSHWTRQYLGRPWAEGRHDCADLVAVVAREQFSVSVTLPSEREWRRKAPEDIASLGEEWAYPVDQPHDGDCVLMKITGSVRDLGSHIGIFAAINGQRWVLHCLAGAGTILTELRMLPHHQLELVGFYRWKANGSP